MSRRARMRSVRDSWGVVRSSSASESSDSVGGERVSGWFGGRGIVGWRGGRMELRKCTYLCL